jgi:hypothetical protein
MWKLILKRDYNWPQPRRGKGTKKKKEKIVEMTSEEYKRVFLDKWKTISFVTKQLTNFLRTYENSPFPEEVRECSHATTKFIHHDKIATRVTHFYCEDCTLRIPFAFNLTIEIIRDRLMVWHNNLRQRKGLITQYFGAMKTYRVGNTSTDYSDFVYNAYVPRYDVEDEDLIPNPYKYDDEDPCDKSPI